MADEASGAPRPPFAGADVLGVSLGLIVFAVGIVMLVSVFTLSYRLFSSIDQQIGQARVTAPAAQGASPSSAPARQPDGSAARTLAQVAAQIGLKLAVLFVMGYAASLVATKGAQLLAAHRARPTIQ